MARGFSQRYGEDYDESYPLAVKHETVKALLIAAVQKRMHVRNFDVKNAYLNGKLTEEIFMEQPGFKKAGQESKDLKLRKSIYKLKQSARV